MRQSPFNNPAGKVNKAGDTMTGNLILKTVEATLTGTYTITENLGQCFSLNPNGAGRDVLLPPDPSIGLSVSIYNSGSAGNVLTVKDSAGVAITNGLVANGITLQFTFLTGGWKITGF